MDIPTSQLRLTAIRSTNYFTNEALKNLTHLFIKLDMHFTHPLGRTNPAQHPDDRRFPPHFARQGFVGCSFRQTLLGERSLTPLWRVLRGWTPDPSEPAIHMDKLDILKLWVRHYYDPDSDDEDDWDEDEDDEDEDDADPRKSYLRNSPRSKVQTVMDLPMHELGTAQLERVNEPFITFDETKLAEVLAHENKDDEMSKLVVQTTNPFYTASTPGRRFKKVMLTRVDEVIMGEISRRQMPLWEQWTSMMVWGWFDPVGRRYPLWKEEDLYRMRQGLPPKHMPKGQKRADKSKKGEDGGEETKGEKKQSEAEQGDEGKKT